MSVQGCINILYFDFKVIYLTLSDSESTIELIAILNNNNNKNIRGRKRNRRRRYRRSGKRRIETMAVQFFVET
jgi:hypothetical protein